MKLMMQLIVCLVLMNSSCAFGMERQTNRALQKKPETSLYSPASIERSEKERKVFYRAYIQCMSHTLSPMALLQLSDTTNCKQTICFNPAISNLFWVLFAENTAVLLYEMYNRKPFLTSHKKNMILGGVNSLVPAVLWACSSMVDDCPQDNPYCLQGRQLFSGLHLLAAGVYLYQASLNK